MGQLLLGFDIRFADDATQARDVIPEEGGKFIGGVSDRK
jgi:hypothetical protein